MIKAQNMAGVFNWSNAGFSDCCQEVIYNIDPTWPTKHEWEMFLVDAGEFFDQCDNDVFIGIEQSSGEIDLYLTFRIFG